MRSLLLLFGALVLVAGCNAGKPTESADRVIAGDTMRPPLNANCTVQFKRDLLGSSASLPIGPTVSSTDGASVAVSGKLLALDDDWVVVDTGEATLWVPRQNVLLLKF